jgi:hypothetical protein
VTIPTQGGTTVGDSYTIELRNKSGWDRGIPADAFVLHLHGQDTYSYWVDVDSGGNVVGHSGGLYAGDGYVDAANGTYIAVNSIDPAAGTGVVTVGSCPIAATATWSGDTSGDYGDAVTLAADLTVSGSGAPIPNAEVSLALGSQGCPAGTKTDGSGHASCTLTLDQVPGSYSAQVAYAGSNAYQAASASQAFTIEREATALTYTGPTTGVYSDVVTVSARLTDADDSSPVAGKTVAFALGTTGSDSCLATTDAAGVVSCSLTPTQPAGDYPLRAAFAGDPYYLGSTAGTTFTVTREQTALALASSTTGGFAGVGDPLTLSGVLTEDDGPPVVGRAVVFTVGGTQSCTGTTDGTGTATCTIPAVNQQLGPAALQAAFAGDAFYLPSSAVGAVTIFAWTTGGNFVIGDGNAAVGATATFWADDWCLRNIVSGGPAPEAFKGFANMPSGRTTCGGTWSTSGGNSPPPTGSVPEYSAVLVTSKMTKSGTTISGSKPHIAVVHVNRGYAPSPGHPGTATVLGLLCGGEAP